ncbi:nSTAND1 domain-containing NTPase [Nocardia gipuzkoensis]|uniref:nSTAND1 domain-containing NTPase n=1 Tax=Nocardia gipuzkoensis TaxID=2749991 RepID=UPI003EE13BEF
MSRIFVSHSSRNAAAAVALKQWLIEQDPALTDEVFLDVDPRTGILAGQRWKDALVAAGARCEAVVCLVSRHWLDSRECQVEYRTAESMGKRIFVARLEPVGDGDITREWQRSDLYGPGPTTTIRIAGRTDTQVFSSAGLQRLWEGLREAGIAAHRFPWPPPGDPDRAPYRGWQPLDPIDAAVYFGRDAQVLRGLDRLRAMRTPATRGPDRLRATRSTETRGLFVVLGPSGTGKSSFLRAGLLPRLARDDREFVVLDIVRPERHPVTGAQGLAAALHAARGKLKLPQMALGAIKTALISGDAAALRQWLIEIRTAATARLLDTHAGAPTVVLPIDQAEELFAADVGNEGRVLLDLLSALLTEPIAERTPLIVATTIRTDRYQDMQSAPQLADVGTELFDELKPIPRERFRDIITGPARRASAAGHRLDFAPDLIDRILADCRDGADTLPLVALTLAALYRDYGPTGRLTEAHYNSLGGIADIVAAEINDILDPDPDTREHELELLRSAFIPWLATVDRHTGQPLRRVARYHDLPGETRPLIDRFVQRRLLVKDHRLGETTVEVALESLLRQWADLAAWLRAQADDLRTADTLEHAAADWERHGHAAAWLLTGIRLDDAEKLAQRPGYRDRLAPITGYLAASRQRETETAETELARAREHADALRGRARVLIAVAAVAVVFAILAGVGFFQQARASDRADARARDATVQQLIALADTNRDSAPRHALSFDLAALRLAPTAANRQNLLDGLLDNRFGGAARLPTRGEHDELDAVDVTYSPDGQMVAVADRYAHHVTLWRISDRKFEQEPISAFDPGPDWVLSVRFTPDGRGLIIVSGTWQAADAHTDLWDIADPAHPRHATRLTDEYITAISPDGHAAVVTVDESRQRLASLSRDGFRVLAERDDLGAVLAFNVDGTLLLTGSSGSSYRLWDVRDLANPVLLSNFTAPAEEYRGAPLFSAVQGEVAAFNRDSTLLALAGNRHGAAVVVDISNPAKPAYAAAFPHDFDAIDSLIFAPDDNTTLLAGSAYHVTNWDLSDPHRPRVVERLAVYSSVVSMLAAAPDGQSFIAGGPNKHITLWNRSRPTTPVPLAQLGGVTSADLSSDGRYLATIQHGSYPDRVSRVTLWSMRDGRPTELLQTPGLPESSTLSVALRPDGRLMATRGISEIVLWDVTAAPQARPIATLAARPAVVFGPGTPATEFVPPGLLFSPDGRTLAVNEHRADAPQLSGIAFWDISDPNHPARLSELRVGETAEYFEAASAQPRPTAAFSPDGELFAANSPSDTTTEGVSLWDISDLRNPVSLGTLPNASATSIAIAFSPDSTRLAASEREHTNLWDLRDPHHPRALGTLPEGPHYGLTFAAHNDVLLRGGRTNSLHVLSITRPDHPVSAPELAGHLDQPISMTTSSGVLISLDAQARLLIWDVRALIPLLHAPEQTACALLRDMELTPNQWKREIRTHPYIDVCPPP